jgi:fucose permease
MIAATAIQTAAQSVGMFIGARFLIGFGVTFAANSAPLLITEIAYPSQRAQLTAVYNTLWYLGSIMCVTLIVLYTYANLLTAILVPRGLQVFLLFVYFYG